MRSTDEGTVPVVRNSVATRGSVRFGGHFADLYVGDLLVVEGRVNKVVAAEQMEESTLGRWTGLVTAQQVRRC